MPTPTTADWRLDVDGLVDEAWSRLRRILAREPSAYDHERALRCIQLLFQELVVRGVELWRIERRELALIAEAASYTLPADTQDVLEAVIYDASGTGGEIKLTRQGRTEYLGLPDKAAPGRPTLYYLDRQRDAPVLKVWPVPPTGTTLQIGYHRVRAFRDVGSPLDNVDAPMRWMPCLISGLAFFVAQGTAGIPTDELGLLEVRWEKDYLAAISDDRERLPLMINYDLGGYYG